MCKLHLIHLIANRLKLCVTVRFRKFSHQKICKNYIILCSEILEVFKFSRLFQGHHQRCSVKKGTFGNFTNFIGKDMCWRLFLKKLQTFRPETLLKRDFNTSIFLWNLQNFSELQFWRSYVNDCFCQIHCFCQIFDVWSISFFANKKMLL